MLENELFSRELVSSLAAGRGNSVPSCFPSSELLDGIHYSASKLYESVPEPYARYYGYDSSALLASGVFMQEYMREAINFISDDIRLAEGSGMGAGNLILSPTSVLVSAAAAAAAASNGNGAIEASSVQQVQAEAGDIFGELALEKAEAALTLQNIPPNGAGTSSKSAAAAAESGGFYAAAIGDGVGGGAAASCSAGTLSHL
jgi:hypothetical protein